MSSTHDLQKDRRQVLVVDDDESIRSLLHLFFEQEGYVVETVANGASALERFDAGHFGIVMVDYCMPGMNGLEVAAALRARDATVTIALITGVAHLLANMDLKPTGITKIFSKPFDLCDMTQWLQSLSDSD